MTIKKNLDIEAILDAITKDHLVVFIGAGVSANSNLPSWSGLVKEFASGLGIEREIGPDDFLKIPQYYYNQRGKNEYFKKIMRVFGSPFSPNKIHDYILKLKPRHIITTNYDDLLEQTIEKHFMFYDTVKEDLDLPYSSNGRMLIKMHGDLTRKNIVLKEDDYLNYSTNFKLIESYVRSIFINNTVLFIGYSLQDYDLKLILKNLQGILGDHFQKAYLIDSSEKPRALVEKEYFKNLGVNLIDKLDISKEFSQKEVTDLKNEQGKNVVRILDYILQYKESVSNPLEYCFEKFQTFDSLNTIRVKDLFSLLGMGSNYFIEEGGVLRIFIEDNDFYLKLIDHLNTIKGSFDQQEWETKRKYDYINFTLSKLNLLTIKVNDKLFTLDSASRKEPSIIRDVLLNNYLSINILAKQNYKPINEYANKIINELMRAYAKYLVNQFFSAFEILEEASRESYRNKSFISLYIIEFNKRYLISKLKRNSLGHQTIVLGTDLGETVFVEQITKVIDTYEKSNLKINDVFEMLTRRDKDNVRFLHDVLQEQGYISQRLLRIKELAEEVEKDLNTRFSSPNSTSVNKMIRDVYEFFDYTHNNFIMVDQYSEVREYYFTFIKSLLSTYSVKEKSEVQTASDDLFSGFLFHRIPNHHFSHKDIVIIFKYLEWRKLGELFKKYNIDEIETLCPSIQLRGLFSNLITSYLEVEYIKGLSEILKNMLCLFGKIKIDKEDLIEIFDKLLKMIISTYVEDEIYLTLLKFLYAQKQRQSIEAELISRLIVSFVNKLLDSKYNGNQQGFELDVLNNHNYLQGLINLMDQGDIDNFKIEIDIEKLIRSIKFGTLSSSKLNILLRVLIPLNRFLALDQQKLVKAAIEEFLLQGFNAKLYALACDVGILLPNDTLEKELLQNIQQMKNEVGKRKVKSYPDPLKSQLGVVVVLLRHNKIKNKELFSQFVGVDDFYDLIFQGDNFDYQKFNLDWFLYLNEVEVEKILSIPANKEIIRKKFVKSLVDNKMEAKLRQLYFDFFES